jgi:hypothetical protein
LLLASSVIACVQSARAGEAVSYTYDALGRLTATSSSATVNNGAATGIAYDRIRFMPNNSGAGTAVITHTIADSLGATATGTFTLNVIQGQC